MLASVKQWIKSLLASARQKQRIKELQATRPAITQSELVKGLRNLGIVEGDIVFLHSSLKSLGFVDGGPNAVIAALREAVGPEGTVMLPTYYMPGGSILATCELAGYVFDPRQHGTNMGALPEAFLRTEGVERSIHPTHSVAAVGKKARYLTEAHHRAPSVFGDGSPWERCWQLNGKVLGLGISMGPVTFYHLLEDRTGDAFPLPVRMPKEFSMPCMTWEGERVAVPVRPLDPAFQPQRIDHKSREDLRDYFYRDFVSAGILTAGQVGEARAWYVRSRDFLTRLEQLMQEGITIYSTAEQLRARRIPE